MSEARTIEGRWWIHGDSKPPCFGVLTLNEEGLVLNAKVLQDRTPEESLKALFDNQGVSKLIHGKDQQNRDVSLFGCFCFKYEPSTGLDSHRIDCLAGIFNCKLTSFDEPRFRAVSVRYAFLDEWLNQHLIQENKTEQGKLAVKFGAGKQLNLNPREGVRLIIKADTTTTWSLGGFQHEAKYRVWFLFDELKSAKEIREDYIPVFLRLLGLLTNEKVFAESVNFYQSDPFENKDSDEVQLSELLCTNNGIMRAKQKTRASRMYATFNDIASGFELVLKQWFECYERMRPVMDLQFAVSNRDASYQTQFLLLAQALEVYHSRSGHWRNEDIPDDEHKKRREAVLQTAPEEYRSWLKRKISNRRPFRERIQEILGFCSEEGEQLTANVVNFTTKVGDSRNYYTHYAERLLQSGGVANGPELIEIRYTLEALLKICLFKELGIQGKPIEAIVSQYKSTTFTHLISPKSQQRSSNEHSARQKLST